jgi:hypothetical protein
MKRIIFIFLMLLSVNVFSKTLIDDPDSLIKYDIDSIMALEYSHLDIVTLKEADWQKVKVPVLWGAYVADANPDEETPESFFTAWCAIHESEVESDWKSAISELKYKPNFLNDKRIQRVIINGSVCIEYEAKIDDVWWSGYLLHCEYFGE